MMFKVVACKVFEDDDHGEICAEHDCLRITLKDSTHIVFPITHDPEQIAMGLQDVLNKLAEHLK